MRVSALILSSLVAACSSPAQPPDPCAVKPVIAGGSTELGLGPDFTAITDGQDVTVMLGLQGLYMFVIQARTRDMDVGVGDREGVITAAVLDQNGTPMSLETGCRVREFVAAGNGYLQLTSAFALPLTPNVTPVLDGAMVTLHVEVRDHEGRRAIDDRMIVAHLPPH